MLPRRKMLGLAATKRSITAVEVAATNDGGRASHAGEFVFPEGVGLQDPVRLGKALKQFLRKEGFSASRCMIGMEGNWLTAREKTLPPGSDGSLSGILALMVEREFASDRKELVFDYALGAAGAAERCVLLVAAPRRMVEGLAAMAQAAGLAVAGITASTMALAAAGNGAEAGEQLVLHLFAGGAELAVHSAGSHRMMRRLPVTTPVASPGAPPENGCLDGLADELRRVVALLPGGSKSIAPRELVIWDEVGLAPSAPGELSERLELPVRICERPAGLERTGGGQYCAAAAMARGALQRRPAPIDLLHSRLTPARSLAIGRKMAWAGGLLAALVVAGVAVALDWRSDSLDAAATENRLKAMEGDLAEAQATIDKVTFARPWYDKRPSYLDCMKELTLAFPQEGGIWTTSLAVREDMEVLFSGKATSESTVLDVLDRLKTNPKLTDVKPLYLRRADRSGREIAFAMSFKFTYSDGTWSSPSAKKSSSRRR
jgi:hypothetical protein